MYVCLHACMYVYMNACGVWWSEEVSSLLMPVLWMELGMFGFRPPGFLLLLGGWVLASKFQTSNLLASCHSLLTPRITTVYHWTRS